MKKIILKAGKEKPLLRKHPWVFSGAIERIVDGATEGVTEGVVAGAVKRSGQDNAQGHSKKPLSTAEPGESALYCSRDGKPLALGYYNPKTQLCGRILSFGPLDGTNRGASQTTPPGRDPNRSLPDGENPDEIGLDQNFWRKRLEQSIGRRKNLLLASRGQTTGCRLVMSESDQLPGLVVDLYGSWLVVQVLTAGIDRVIDQLINPLWEITTDLLASVYAAALRQGITPLPPQKLEGILEKSDDAMRTLEGLPARVLVRREQEESDKSSPKEQKEFCSFRENGITLTVDLYGGQKTGYYHDQRDNHALIGSLAQDLKVLDCCSYTGGFTLAALQGGARQVISLDQSANALDRLEHHLHLNETLLTVAGETPLENRWKRMQGDAFKLLRQLADDQELFDLVILDPPKFAAKESHVQKAARGYKDLNLWGLRLVRPGGLLATFSCSGHINPDLFQKIVFGAALDAKKEVQIIRWFQQGEDHPVLMSFPESYYLKGLLLRVL